MILAFCYTAPYFIFSYYGKIGPSGVPILGYLPFLSNEKPVYKTMKMLAKTYGPVAAFYVGPNQPFISVVGPLAVMEALNNEDLNGRPSNSVILARTFGEKLGLLYLRL